MNERSFLPTRFSVVLPKAPPKTPLEVSQENLDKAAQRLRIAQIDYERAVRGHEQAAILDRLQKAARDL